MIASRKSHYIYVNQYSQQCSVCKNTADAVIGRTGCDLGETRSIIFTDSKTIGIVTGFVTCGMTNHVKNRRRGGGYSKET